MAVSEREKSACDPEMIVSVSLCLLPLSSHPSRSLLGAEHTNSLLSHARLGKEVKDPPRWALWGNSFARYPSKG